MKCSPLPCQLVPLRPKYSSQHLWRIHWKILTLSINGRLVEYVGFVHINVGCCLTVSEEKQILRNISYIWVSPTLGTTIAFCPPRPYFRYSPLLLKSNLKFDPNYKSRLWFVIYFVELRRHSKDHVKLCDNRRLLPNWIKKMLSELYLSLCPDRQDMTGNPAAWYFCNLYVIRIKPSVVHLCLRLHSM
jgi:hypothetical protein